MVQQSRKTDEQLRELAAKGGTNTTSQAAESKQSFASEVPAEAGRGTVVSTRQTNREGLDFSAGVKRSKTMKSKE